MKPIWIGLIAILFFCLGLFIMASCGDDDDDDDNMWSDPPSGLTWQNPPSSDIMRWENAVAYCENLNFDGHDDWRLPTISELRSLIQGCAPTETGGLCGVTDDCLDTSCMQGNCYCDYEEGSCYGSMETFGKCQYYWSSSIVEDYVDTAWYVNFGEGRIEHNGISFESYARCVR